MAASTRWQIRPHPVRLLLTSSLGITHELGPYTKSHTGQVGQMTPEESSTVAALVTSCGAQNYGLHLDELARLFASFDMSCAFAYRYDHTPEVIHDGYSAAVSRDALSRYLKGGYLLDPFYVACISGEKAGLWRMREIAPDGFFSSDFVSSREVHPCISEDEGSLVEEIGFIIPLGDGASAVYSLMRNKGGSPFSTNEFERLQVISPIIAASMQRHRGGSGTTQQSPPQYGTSESAFRLAFGDRLTPTQHNVVRLILRGHSNVSIAAHMGIAEGTAKLHRHNIYRRLNITSQSELFQLFIEHLG